MEYRGWTVEAQYLPGADFRILKSGEVVPRKPTNKDIDFYRCSKDGERAFNEFPLSEAKAFIDHLEAIKRRQEAPVQDRVFRPLITGA
jgi:hypothetical protein